MPTFMRYIETIDTLLCDTASKYDLHFSSYRQFSLRIKGQT